MKKLRCDSVASTISQAGQVVHQLEAASIDVAIPLLTPRKRSKVIAELRWPTMEVGRIPENERKNRHVTRPVVVKAVVALGLNASFSGH